MPSLKRPNDDSAPSTPSKRRHCGDVLAFHTPFSKKSNVHSTHTQSLTTVELNRRQRSQIDLKSLLRHELGRHTYQADWVHSHFCPVPSETVDDVIRHLGTHICELEPKFTLKVWPTGQLAEEKYYPPFAKLLNAIIKAFEERCPNEFEESVFQDIKFVQYGRGMKESVSGERGLKPDILALDIEEAEDLKKESVSWHSTPLVGEVKADLPDLIAQAGTYARCLFAAADHRVFVPVLTLRHTTADFRLCFFHRSGLVATKAMKITTSAGFRDFVATIVGLWRWNDLKQAGYVPTQSRSHFSFNNTRYHIHRVLCRRQAIYGRVTSVYAVDIALPAAGTRRFLAPPPEESEGAEWRHLNPFDWPPQENTPSGTVNVDSPDPLPNTLIVKCSYQPMDRINEVDVFRDVQGYIGIPEIMFEYTALGFAVPADEVLEPWYVVSEQGDTIPPYEARMHRHLVMRSKGRPLSSDMTFKQVGYAILHAMIGHCALFTVGSYLHRDVSNGNIILLDNPVTSRRIPPLLQGIVSSTDCTSALIDGDVAKKWGSSNQSSSDRSGTLPFISARLMDQWSQRKGIVHTPIDDLESFAWVVLYSALAWTPHNTRTSRESGWWDRLNSDDISVLADCKGLSLSSHWGAKPKQIFLELSPIVQRFQPFLHALFALSLQHSTSYRYAEHKHQPSDQVYNLFEAAYKEFIAATQEEVAKLPDTTISSVLAEDGDKGKDGDKDEDEDEDEEPTSLPDSPVDI